MKRKFIKNSVAGNSRHTETIKTKSLTVPDQSLSVRTILQKFANNTLNDIGQDEYYSDDDDDIRGYDPAEMLEMAKNASGVVKKETDRQEKARKEREAQALKKKHREEFLAEQQQQNPT